MIRFEHVSKVYPTRLGDRVVLNDISFTLAPGEKLGVMGRNGAGKSTLIRLVSGAENPTSGLVEQTMSVSWPLAFSGAFHTALTGKDNVRFISRIYNQDFRKNLTFIEEFSELGTYLDEPIRSYSSGMRARLAFAISMIIEFDCYLIDEISAVGDVRFHEKCQVELFERRADRAMLIVSHDLHYIQAHCQHFAVLHQGRMKFFDDFDTAHQAHLDAMHIEDYQFPDS
jgi:ABC-2 type transport system ATP-binding protein/capsular polysaccharide transport system ATP-binding protein